MNWQITGGAEALVPIEMNGSICRGAEWSDLPLEHLPHPQMVEMPPQPMSIVNTILLFAGLDWSTSITQVQVSVLRNFAVVKVEVCALTREHRFQFGAVTHCLRYSPTVQSL